MEIHYQKQEKGIVLTACYGYDSQVILPDEIEGVPIIAIAPYAFSNGEENPEDLVWKSSEDVFEGEKIRLKTTAVTEIHLPKGIREVGRYAFYRCNNLRKLVLSNQILEIGGGALNGCRSLREVEIHLWDNERSALKSIVDEIRFEIHVKLYHHKNGEIKISEILFPEHYEEAVENTPARILYTSHHGAGGYYRQCFYNREIDYKKYDELLPWAIAGDDVENVLKLAMLRLRFPYQLSEKAKIAYEAYLKEKAKESSMYFVEKEAVDSIRFCLENKFWDKDALLEGIEVASREKKTEILSILMDEKQKSFPKKRKTFDL